MKVLVSVAVLLTVFTQGLAYSKYGRSCKDIGCRSNEVCVMESDPCTFSRSDCGSYPTCKRTTASKQTCSTYVCPPTKVCRMDGATPKCVDDHSGKSSQVGYNTQATGANQAQPSGGQQGGLYPNLANNQPQQPQQPQQPTGNRQAYPGYPGYQQPGGGYQQPGGGYYQQPGYQQPGQYPGYQGGYQPYPQYPQNYPQGNYGGGGQKSGSNPITDALTDSLKTIGTDLLKNAFSKLLQGNFGAKQNAPTSSH